ncbi:cupin domain-containing protein [Alcanivorax sp. S6407]|uniref:(R)-mandelonitrile lyase n=1 Tax=Alcanivorax sp. S6407 TaxID=2926424 RepID=UPI001FF14204|nr:cupin domain-containing protein [Alcanivorax sp. S6407]MCK0154827.1 cupin domain-containing protein [Alcanivorax sp. S6407]
MKAAGLKTGMITVMLMAAGAVSAEPAQQQIRHAGSQASVAGPEKLFSGAARIDPLFPGTDQINASGAYVTFEPGARSAWHTHPKGQHIIVTHGVGLTQEWGKPIEQIKPGDVVWCPPGVKHWHGAAPNTAMTHLVVTGQDEEGNNVTWMEKVSDEQYSQ